MSAATSLASRSKQWKSLLCEVRFAATVCVADCPDAGNRAALGDYCARPGDGRSSPALAPQVPASRGTGLYLPTGRGRPPERGQRRLLASLFGHAATESSR